MTRYLRGFFILMMTTGLTAAGAHGDLLCIKKKLTSNSKSVVAHAKALRVTSDTCPRGYNQLLDTAEFRGADGQNGAAGQNGAPGQDGADATTLLYGTGSAGDLLVSSGTYTLDDPNLNFENITIAAGATINVRSGSVLRCTGQFTNAGTINIYSSANGGWQAIPGTSTITQRAYPPTATSLTGKSATNGECGTNADVVLGGSGSGSGLADATPLFPVLTRIGTVGGGGGGCSGGTINDHAGGSGGGVAFIVCSDTLSNSGTIKADGRNASSGAGGGGGGLIVLGSASEITNTGTISAIGGNGGASSTSRGAGGGGSGGVVIFISPTITAGTTVLTGGAAGSNAVAVTQSPRCGGGGGGPSISWGGDGGSVQAAGTASAAYAGQDGDTQSITEDPAAVLHNL